MSAIRRGESYTVAECENFITIMELVLPLSKYDWETVEEEHGQMYAEKHRTALSIRKKYNKLLKSGPPTGDPDCPDHIRRAK